MTYTIGSFIKELEQFPKDAEVYFWNDDDCAWNNHGCIQNGISGRNKEYPNIIGIASYPYEKDEITIHP